DWQKFVAQHQDGARRALALLAPARTLLELSDRHDRFRLFALPSDFSAPAGRGDAERLRDGEVDHPVRLHFARAEGIHEGAKQVLRIRAGAGGRPGPTASAKRLSRELIAG